MSHLLLLLILGSVTAEQIPWNTVTNGSELLLYYPQTEDGTPPKFAFEDADAVQTLTIQYTIATRMLKIEAEIDLDKSKNQSQFLEHSVTNKLIFSTKGATL